MPGGGHVAEVAGDRRGLLTGRRRLANASGHPLLEE